ncbi:MAG: hypothetical protein V2I66_03720, partial [Halieaceae bacterium]|nr:hypothetical protein [Halieaceae bacterium]
MKTMSRVSQILYLHTAPGMIAPAVWLASSQPAVCDKQDRKASSGMSNQQSIDPLLVAARKAGDKGNNALWLHLQRAMELERQYLQLSVAQGRFWFVDVPRTGSTGIRLALGKSHGYPHGNRKVPNSRAFTMGAESSLITNHVPAHLVRQIITPEIWNQLFTFAVVRNPFDWVQSLYLYNKQFATIGLPKDSFSAFLQGFAKFLELPKSQRHTLPSMFTQSDYILDWDSGEQIVSECLRFEDRTAIGEVLRTRCNVEWDSEQVVMATSREELDISDADRKLVRELFSEDFERFGY